MELYSSTISNLDPTRWAILTWMLQRNAAVIHPFNQDDPVAHSRGLAFI